jgi:ABC-type uncharacterized transport system auxiliary subunit
MSRVFLLRVSGLLIPVLCVGLSGCIKLPDFNLSKKTVVFYTLDYPPPKAVVSEPVAGVTLLRRLTTSSMYGTDRMVTQGTLFTMDFSYYERWAASPASMLNDFLYRDLCDSGLFEAVLNGPGFLRPKYELSGTLEEIQASHTRKGWETVITVNILFFPYSDNSQSPAADRIYQKRYEVTVPYKNTGVEAMVASMSACMQKFSEQLIRDLDDHLKRSPKKDSLPAPAK